MFPSCGADQQYLMEQVLMRISSMGRGGSFIWEIRYEATHHPCRSHVRTWGSRRGRGSNRYGSTFERGKGSE